jgi:prepilin peptidase CpaA
MPWQAYLEGHWPIVLVSATLIVAAICDGTQLRVPNWITFPLVFTGFFYQAANGGWEGLITGLMGLAVGLVCLLPLYAVGGMGAGDVKLLAGVGVWLGATATFQAFCVSALVGAVMALGMIWRRGNFVEHYANLLTILSEWIEIRDPRQLAQLAAQRQPKMLLLPYAIPLCIGSIGYFVLAGIV